MLYPLRLAIVVVLVSVLAACGTSNPPAPTVAPEATEDVIQDLGGSGFRAVETPLMLPTRNPALGWAPTGELITAQNAYLISNTGVLASPDSRSTTFSYGFSSDGTRLVTLNNDYFYGWDLITGRRFYTNTRQSGIRIYMSPDKVSPLLLTETGELLIFGENGRLVNSFQSHSAFSIANAYDPFTGWLAVGGDDGTVKVWDVVEEISLVTLEAHTGRVSELAFNGDSRFLVTAGEDQLVKVWDWQTRTLIETIENPTDVYSVTFNPATDQLAIAGTTFITLWQVAESGVSFQYTIETTEGGTDLVMFSPDGRYLLTGGRLPDLALWGAEDVSLLAMLPNSGGERASAAFNATSDLLLTASLDSPVTLTDLSSVGDTSLRRAQLQASDRVTSVAFTPDGYAMVFFQAQGDISLWGVTSQEVTPG